MAVTSKAQTTEEKRDKRDYIRLKNFRASNDATNRGKKQPTESKEIFANHDKG